MKNFFKFLSSCIHENSGVSSKAFSLVLSAVIGALIGLSICVVLIWDVCVDGIINTNLNELGIFLIAVGVFMVGGSASKTIAEIRESKKPTEEEITEE